jgi:alkanesulfonate monooxygenase SsuD/methylene tetrahydromethanopterin reductase-like flavin-dependent oxidoreductase (luciferase family)
MVRAFTEEGPFEFQGEFFHVPYANLWPKPIQQPYPEVWIPAAGSKVTLERAARHRYTYQCLFSPRNALKRNVSVFRDLAEKNGYTASPKQVAAVLFIHVAETDEQARREAEPHLLYLMQNINRAPQWDAFPPGHFSKDSLRGFMTKGGYRQKDLSEMTIEDVEEEGWGIIGSPATVAEKIEEIVDDLDCGKIIHIADFGAMPNWMLRKSLTLMAEDVIPKFRDKGGHPIWAIKDPRPAPTHAEYGALKTEPEAVPEARIHGHGVVDLRTAHIEELRKKLRD